MDNQTVSGFGADRPGVVLYSSAGRLRSLPAVAVRGITRATVAAAVPFSPPAYEGLVEADGLITPQFDLGQALGGDARGGGYAMLVDTSAGPLRLRVDSVSFAEAATVPAVAEAPASGLAEIETLTAGLAPAEPHAEPPCAIAESGDGDPPIDALIVRSGGLTLALAARNIERIDRHQGSRPTRRGDGGERIVTLDGDILPGWSLAAWLSGAANPALDEDAWAVVVRIGGRRSVLTVAGVDGLVSASAARVRRLRHGRTRAVWLLDAGRGLIEVIDPADVTSGRPRPDCGAEDETADDPPLAPPERRAAERGRLALGLGPFRCVFSGAVIAEILGGDHPGRLSARRGRAGWPLLDPAFLLGLPGSGADSGRTMVLRRPGRRPLALRAPDLGPSAFLPEWQPLPLLPWPAHSLFRSVRIACGACDFLVRDDAFDRPRDPVIAGLLRAARTDWLDGC
ncbi:MAG: chemotaxis protein CheW [Rhodospirillaceae bacterium]